MARCRRCGRCSQHAKAHNWKEWQLCYPCARVEHPEHYADKRNHGIYVPNPNQEYRDMTSEAVIITPKQS